VFLRTFFNSSNSIVQTQNKEEKKQLEYLDKAGKENEQYLAMEVRD